MNHEITPVLLIIILLFLMFASVAHSEPARNIILIIGDGMGMQQIEAGRFFMGRPFCFESWPGHALVDTRSFSSLVTDSAAASTAMATGYRVNNGMISCAVGTYEPLETILEYLKAKGKKTGLATSTYTTSATPAGFGAHTTYRTNIAKIAADYFNVTKPDVLLGGGGLGITPASASAAGYTVVTDRNELLALDAETTTMVSGQFGAAGLPYEYTWVEGYPHLSDIAAAALHILDNGTNGFFVMIESGFIDGAGHANRTDLLVHEMVEFDNTVQTVINWVSNRTDTLVLVTADHETGGLIVQTNNGPGVLPTVVWQTIYHTSSNVGVWAMGPKSEMVYGVINNTDIYQLMLKSYLLDSTATTMQRTNNQFTADWSARIGDTYHLQFNSGLNGTQWQTINVLTAQTENISVLYPPAVDSRGYYRVISVK